jgi:ribonuclease VapC
VPDAEPASILDASALIAYMHDEPGADAVVDAITETAAISVVNWAETLSKVAADGGDPQQIADSLQASDSPLILEALTDADCVEIARLRP